MKNRPRPKTSLSKAVEAFACLPFVVSSELPPIRLETKTMLESQGNSYCKFCTRKWENSKPGGLDWSRRDLDRDLDLDAQKVSVSTVFKS